MLERFSMNANTELLNKLDDEQIRFSKIHKALSVLVDGLDIKLPQMYLRELDVLQQARRTLSELRESGAV